MRILLISYSDYRYDGRLRALIAAFSKIGEVTAFIRRGPSNEPGLTICDRSYGDFIARACRMAKQMRAIDILALDNRRSIIPGFLVKRILKPKLTILDCRELYLINEVKSGVSKIGCLLESAAVRKADVVISANEERAELMERRYRLSNRPLVYENLRQLRYESDEAKEEARKKVSQYIRPGEYRILSTSGCSVSRTNDLLVENMTRVKYPCRLFLVGNSSKRDERTIQAIVKEKGLRNVEIVGQLNQSELKAFIQNSHIGIVNYHQNDSNNKFCASGKLYEFVYEGVPIVTTTNPPLERLCRLYGIGVSDDLYADGINETLEHYEAYKNAVNTFARRYTVDANDEKIVGEICHELERLGIQVKTAEE